MPVIKNFDQLASTPQRKIVLQLIEAAFESITPQNVLSKNISLENDMLKIQEKTYDLKNFEHVFLVGFGKGSADVCKIIEEKLGGRLTEGYDIDVIDEYFSKIQYTKGTHPLPSEENIAYTKKIVEHFSGNLTEKDLMIVVVCGGGSVLFEMPHTIDLETLIAVNKALLRSGATISEMNSIRKHLSATKGGGFARMLYPATVTCLLFSDVPGNDISVIASGPTVKDPTTVDDVKKTLEKYNLIKEVNVILNKNQNFSLDAFQETPKDDMYFENVSNVMILSNQTALTAMQQKAKELGYEAKVYSDRVQGDAKDVGKMLIDQTPVGQILLAGGETTVKVTGTGKGGRNQELVLAALPYLDEKTIITSFDSDGQDFYLLAGAIGDSYTVKKAQERNLDQKKFLDDHNSFEFWQNVGDGILTGKLESNVSDLMIVYKC